VARQLKTTCSWQLRLQRSFAIRKILLNIAALALLFLLLLAADRWADEYQVRLLNNVAIFITLAVSYNLINGVCGQLHLGPNAFITLGAYTAALLTLTPAEKALNFMVTPLYWPLSQMALPFPLALLAGGLVAAAFGVLTGFPVFRVRGDYLAIVTLGFGEVVRVLANNLQGLTNGPLGLKGLQPCTTLWWAWGVAVLAVMMITALVKSSHGRAMQAIREDETAARAMGVNSFRLLMLAYVLSAFFFGVGGGLLAHLITTISPSLFTFFLTFNLLIIIVVGGLGSVTGSVLAAALITLAGELLRVVEEPHELWGLAVPGILGMRMVILSLVLLLAILYFRRGLLGRREFSWDFLWRRRSRSGRPSC
jgi:branched-chain amino acid transport system permease protein